MHRSRERDRGVFFQQKEVEVRSIDLQAAFHLNRLMKNNRLSGTQPHLRRMRSYCCPDPILTRVSASKSLGEEGKSRVLGKRQVVSVEQIS